MRHATVIVPERRRNIRHCTFGWVDHNFVHHGYLARLSPAELLLYYFLITVADRHGVSFYDYERICQLLKVEVDEYVRARDHLCAQSLIAYHDGIFQVLALPEKPLASPPPQRAARQGAAEDFHSLQAIFQKLTH